jgi:O-acetylhomoserine/O-acetylserine sulfhydrylase-like pyridoxal-dependent enzyme
MMLYPPIMFAPLRTAAERERLALRKTLSAFSGIEDAEDVIADLDHALA